MSGHKIDYETFESLKLNFSEQTETAEKSFREYYNSVMTMEYKIRLIKAEEELYCDKFTKEDNSRIIRNLDTRRTILHNTAIAKIKNLNKLSGLLDLDDFMSGSISEESDDRTEIADALFEFCKAREFQKGNSKDLQTAPSPEAVKNLENSSRDAARAEKAKTAVAEKMTSDAMRTAVEPTLSSLTESPAKQTDSSKNFGE